MNPQQGREPVSREELRSLLDRWQMGEVNERTVHEVAEDWYDKYGEAAYPKDDRRSIAFEVVSELSILNVQLITPDDIPAFLEFLATPSGGEQAAWEKFMHDWDGIDFERRAVELEDNLYYGAFPPRHDG